MIRAVIFDMDGLLIDSEPLWGRAETEVFAAIGRPIALRTADFSSKPTMGMRVEEVVDYYYREKPWKTPSKAVVADRIVQRLIELVNQVGQPLAGIDQVIQLVGQAGLPIALASSSRTTIIEAVLAKLAIAQHITVIHSAEHEHFGKPHPGVYITTAKKLGVDPTDCVAFEDSPNGVLAAKAAKMRCIAVPEPASRHDRRFGIADYVVDSLADVTAEMLK